MIMDDTKLCSKCKIERPRTEFSKNKRNKDCLDSQCKHCLRLKYQATREKQLQSQRKWRERNPHYQQMWREDNDNFQEYIKQYYQDNKENTSKRKQQWRKSNPEKAVEERIT